MKWHDRASKDDFPATTGWYRVMISSDSESIDGHQIYAYPDYETWAHFSKADNDEYEDFENGYKGMFVGAHDEENDMIFAWYGPFLIPSYK